MNKWLDLPVPLLRNLKVEAIKNGTTLRQVCSEILQNFLDNPVPIVTAPAGDRTKVLIELSEADWNHLRELARENNIQVYERTKVLIDIPEVDWEQARTLARKNNIPVHRAFESSAVQLGYLKPATV